MLHSDVGGRRPKHVGGNSMCIDALYCPINLCIIVYFGIFSVLTIIGIEVKLIVRRIVVLFIQKRR